MASSDELNEVGQEAQRDQDAATALRDGAEAAEETLGDFGD